MRISDWSSDVCSSDLVALVATGLGALGVPAILGVSTSAIAGIAGLASGLASIGAQALAKPPPARGSITQLIVDPNAPQPYVMGGSHFAGVLRSEEHTSELQSLMRISYAVFCLTKKTHI